MKKILFLCGLVLGCSSLSYGDAAVAAVVNGDSISRDEVLQQVVISTKKFKEAGKELTDAQKVSAYKMVLERLVGFRVLLSAATKAGVEGNEDFKKAVEELNKAVDEQKKIFKIQFFLKKKQEEAEKAISPDRLRETVKALGAKEVQVTFHQMVVKNRPIADRIKKAVEGGKDFVKLAREYSIEKEKKLSPTTLPLSYFPEEFRKELAAVKLSEVLLLQPESNGEVIVFQLLKKEKITNQEMLKKMASDKMERENTAALMEKLYKEAEIKCFDQDGKPMPAPDFRSPAAP